MPPAPATLSGARRLTRPRMFSSWLPPERQPFPCHGRVPALLDIDHDLPHQSWELRCPIEGCEHVYRFTKRDGWLSWQPSGARAVSSDRPEPSPEGYLQDPEQQLRQDDEAA